MKTVDDRGKLSFKEEATSKELEETKSYWESFLKFDNSEERDQYLRSLEIQFSLDAMSSGENTEAVDDLMATVFSKKKIGEHEAKLREEK